MLKANKWQMLVILLILVIGLLWISSSYLRSADDVTIDNITLSTLITGEEVSKEDMQGCVVGILFWGKW
jgi:uncharacterized membrane protein (Fun14 family)